MFRYSGLARQPGFVPIFCEEIQQRERQVLLILAETARDTRDHFLLGDRLAQLSCQGAQGLEPPLADHAVGFFGYYAQMPGNRAVVSSQRTVRKSVISLLTISAPLQKQKQRFIPRRLTGLEHSLNARTNVVPDFLPHFARRLSQCPRVFLPERHPRVVIVVEKGEFRSPAHPHGKARREQGANNGFQALWPLFDGTERGLRPIEFTYQLPQRPSAAHPSWPDGG